MKKSIILVCMFFMALAVTAQSGAKFDLGESQTMNKHISPNGKWLVGESTEYQEWGEEGLQGYASFLQDVATGERTWLTTFDNGDYNKTGSFTDVTDDGVICGVVKDPDNKVTWTDWNGTYTLPLNVAAIWQQDGTLTKLGLGTYTSSDFKQLSDGTYAMAISNDAKTVVGYVAFANFATYKPVGWVYNETTRQYDFKQYAMPEGYVKGQILDVCGDGSVAVGFVMKSLGHKEACFWISPDQCFVIENTKPVSGVQNDGVAYVISNNGRYIGCSLSGREPARLVFVNKEQGEYQIKYLGLREGYSEVTVDGVTDGGDMLGKYVYPVNGLQSPYYYDSSSQKNVDFDYFVYLYARDIQDEMPFTFTHYGYESVSFSGISADGKVIAGNDYSAPWTLTTEKNFVIWPETVSSIKAKATALGEVTVTVPKLKMDPYVFYDAKEFVLYRNGQEVKRIAKADLEDGYTEITFVDQGVKKGANYYSVAVNWTDSGSGEDILSPRCGEIVVNMDANFAFPLFDDFETSGIAAEGWWVDRHYGETALQNIGCGPYFGLNTTHYLNYAVFQSVPYSFALVSRHMDATDKESVYMSFARKWSYINQTDWELTKDTLSLEVSVDDENWIKVKDLGAYDIEVSKWGFEYVDLTPWAAGKVFQVRLHAHGQAASQILWVFDNVRIDEKPAQKPVDGLTGINIEDNGFRLTWKNTLGAYGLNYFGNRMYNVENKIIGNEGKDFIAINKFDAADLQMYVGKYLTSVSNEFYYFNEATKPLRAALVVYENGKLVRDQEILEPQNNIYATYKLDEPLQIKEGSEVWVGIKLIDYDPAMMPIRYQNTSDFVDGKSNIYSEDGGETWLNLADYYETVPGHETDGYASWQFTANITDTKDMPEDKIDLNFYALEIYKNGEKCRDLFVDALQGWYTDNESSIGDKYQVRWFALYDGTCSELSAEFVNDGTTASGINGVVKANNGGYIIDGETLLVNGDNKRVVLYDASGVKLYEGNASSLNMRSYGKGLFILKVYGNDGAEQTHKLMF